VAAALAVALLLVTAGCASFVPFLEGSGGPTEETTSTTSMTDREGPRSTTTGGQTGDGTGSETTLASVTSNQTAALEDAGSFTLLAETRIADDRGALVETRRTRVGDDGRVYVNSTRRVTASETPTLLVEYYSEDETVFVREGLLGGNASTYERRQRSGVGNESATAGRESAFDFAHERTADGDHRFTVDSVDQIDGDLQGEGEVTEVSARLLVDGETGLVTETRYHLKRVSEDGRSVTVESKRVLSDLGATSVPTPAWLSEARQRTTPNSTLVFEPITEPIVVNRTVNIS
jgi:hypothetical protein